MAVSIKHESVKIVFPAKSFATLATPFKGVRDSIAVVSVADLPDLTGWRKVNVRDPRKGGAVSTAIAESLSANEHFMFLNQGIVLNVEKAHWADGELTLTLSNPNEHGLFDGGHTYAVLMAQREALTAPQFVKVEVLEGFDKREVAALIEARNTSAQVKTQSLLNFSGEFERIKKALADTPYANKIAYKEYDLDDEGKARTLDIRDIVAVLMCFDTTGFPVEPAAGEDATHPIDAYRSKQGALRYFSEHQKHFGPLYPLLPDFLRLYDEIRVGFPFLYSGRASSLAGVATYKKPWPVLPFSGQSARYKVPGGYVFPFLASFRALLKERAGVASWSQSPFKALAEKGGEIANLIGERAREVRSAATVGKSTSLWQGALDIMADTKRPSREATDQDREADRAAA